MSRLNGRSLDAINFEPGKVRAKALRQTVFRSRRQELKG